jgi:hypothetical protein
MRQPMVPVIDAVNAAFPYLVTATELLCVLQYIFLRFEQTQFPLTVPHCGDPNQPQIGCCWWAVKLCKFLQLLQVQKWDAANSPVFNQLLSIQLSSSDAPSKIPKMIVKEPGN